MGRDFTSEEGQPGKDHEVILFNRLWQRLGARPDIVGQQLRINGEQYTVVGVMAPGPTDRLSTQLVVPLAFKPETLNHDFHWLLVMASEAGRDDRTGSSRHAGRNCSPRQRLSAVEHSIWRER